MDASIFWIMWPLSLCILLLSIVQSHGNAISELVELQQDSPDGVIHFNPSMFETYASGKGRTYSFIVFLTAEHMKDQPKLGLGLLREEFGLASKAYKQKYATGPRSGKVFFITLEVTESGAIFQRLGAESLPFIFHLAPHTVVPRTGKIDISSGEMMSFHEARQYPWKAEVFAEFVKTRSGYAVEEIPRTDTIGTRITGLLMLLLLGLILWTARRLYDTPFVQSKWPWMVGAVFVCWFSTSGAMFNIIRGVPFALPKDGKLQLLYPGNGQQLGAEGFIMGTMYIFFSGMIVIITYGVPRVHNPTTRRASFLMSVLGACFILRHIVGMYSMKTGYHLQQYVF